MQMFTTIYVTHHGIALELGTSRKVVSRTLISFQSPGLVHLTRSSIAILNFEKLKI